MSRKRRGTNNRNGMKPRNIVQLPTAEKAESVARSTPLLATDAYLNRVAFLGEASELMAANDFERNSITRDVELLTVMYRENWIAKRIIDTPCEDMTRAWYTLASSLEQDKLDELAALEAKHNIKQEITNGLRWARLYGGAAAVIVIKGQEDMLDQPLDFDGLMPGCFRGLIIVDRSSGLTPSVELEEDWDDPEYNYPKYYDVVLNNNDNSVVRVHHSRLIVFRGRMLPLMEERNESFWGASELEHVYDELQKRNATSANIAQMVFQANITVTKMADYAEVLGMGTERQKAEIMQTIFEQNRIKNAFGTMIMGKDDNYEQHAYSFGGLQEIYEVFMLDMAGAAEIPATKLYGRAPQGMNATGESDMKNYYETIAQLQERHLRPAIMKLLPIMCMSLWGEAPEDMEIVFGPVMTTTPTERATIVSQFASTIMGLYTAGVISRKRALMELVATCKEIGGFTSITQDFIDAAEDDVDQGEMGGMGEDPMAAMMGGMGDMGGGPEMPSEEPEVEPEEQPAESEAQKKPEEAPVSFPTLKQEKEKGKPEEPPQKPKEVKTEPSRPKKKEDEGKDEAVPEGMSEKAVKALMTAAAKRGDIKRTLAIVRAYPQYFGKTKQPKDQKSDNVKQMRGMDESVKRAHPSMMDRFRSFFRRSMKDAAPEDTGWRTASNGKHYQINEEGDVVKGPKAMVGGNVNEPQKTSETGNAANSRFESLNVKTLRMHPDLIPENKYFSKVLPEASLSEMRDDIAKQKMDGVEPTTEKVDLSTLITDQEIAHTENLKKMVEKAPTIEEIESLSNDSPITAYEKNGEYYLIDGNHRTLAAMLYGANELEMQVYHADANTFENKESLSLEKPRANRDRLNRTLAPPQDSNGIPFMHRRVILPPKEYGHVMHEINTMHDSNFAGKQSCYIALRKDFNNPTAPYYIYRFENHGFNEYNIYDVYLQEGDEDGQGS